MDLTSNPFVDSRERRPQRRRIAFFSNQSSRVSAPKRCSCGGCTFCLDNARWEQIFSAKFADPTYYSPRLPKVGSTLSKL